MIQAKPTKKNDKKKKGRKVAGNYNGYLTTSWGVQAREFFQHTSLHGVRYIAESGRPFMERFMWFTCVTAGAVSAAVIIFNLWEKFQTNPTITGLATDFHTWEVPFPAVILCQKEPANVDRVMEYLGYSGNSSFEDEEKKQFFLDLSQMDLTSIRTFFTKYPKQSYVSSNEDIKSLLFDLMNVCEDVFVSCSWKAESYDCCDGFFASFTEKGFCYAFNSEHYFHEHQLLRSQERKEDFQQKYIQETDMKWSLEFEVKSNITTAIYIIGSKDLLGIGVKPQHFWDFKVNKISFSVKETFTTLDAIQLSIQQRHCIFPKEVPLKVNDDYTYAACMTQCYMDKAMEICGCVPFFYPQRTGYKFCKINELQVCFTENQKLKDIESIETCACQLGCIHTVYEIEKLDQFSGGISKEDDQTGQKRYSMTTEFVSWPMVRYKREVLFGWVDLLVSFGGIAGLFLGFSLLSGVEIVYYFTIRACCMVIREKEELLRVQREKASQPRPEYDLSLVPYFISEPLPGRGINEVAQRFCTKNLIHYRNKIVPIKGRNHWKISDTIISPFGIEFVN